MRLRNSCYGCSQEFNPLFLSRGGSRTGAWWCLQEALSQKAVGDEVLPFLEGCVAPLLNSRHSSALAAWDRHSPALQTHELGVVPCQAASKNTGRPHSACSWQRREVILSPCLVPTFSGLQFLHLLCKETNHGDPHGEPLHPAGRIKFTR